MNPSRAITLTILTTLMCGGVLFADSAFAQEFQPLANLPALTDTAGEGERLTLASYINTLFLLSISLGALLAVIKIALAGVTHMFSDIVPEKSKATADITGALLGLGILIATTVVLNTINPQLINLDIFQEQTFQVPVQAFRFCSQEEDTSCTARLCRSLRGGTGQWKEETKECFIPTHSAGAADPQEEFLRECLDVPGARFSTTTENGLRCELPTPDGEVIGCQTNMRNDPDCNRMLCRQNGGRWDENFGQGWCEM